MKHNLVWSQSTTSIRTRQNTHILENMIIPALVGRLVVISSQTHDNARCKKGVRGAGRHIHLFKHAVVKEIICPSSLMLSSAMVI